MVLKGLIVEDDLSIVPTLEDCLFSMGHECLCVTNQSDARNAIQAHDFDYVLLDLQIPARPHRGGADKQFGINLLEEIKQNPAKCYVPVIIMTAYLADGLNLSRKLSVLGAAEFIAKPFQSDRSIAKVIRSVLKGRSSTEDRAVAKDSHRTPTTELVVLAPGKDPDASVASLCGPRAEKPEPQPFAGGEMVFHEDRVTLCGVTILVNSRAKQMRKILGALRPRTTAGSYIARSGPELASELSITGGQNGVEGAIRDFRKNAADILLVQLDVISGLQDIIRSGGPGYRFNEWISICNAEQEPTQQATVTIVEQPARRGQILETLRRGQKLRSTNIATELGCSAETVKRELDALRSDGLVEFVGPTKTGTYQLRK